jgi:hypothetical protein
MKILKEITEWNETEYTVPNHTYAINDAGKMAAYRKTGTKDWIVFSKPRMFDRTRRKFITLEKDVGMEYVLRSSS